MKKLALTLAVLFTLSTPANAAVPVCELGGATAMDTNRSLAEGETFVLTDRPLVVNLRFKPTKEHPEQVGECMLPSGSEVAVKNGILQWVRACGNDEVNRNVLVVATQEPEKKLDGLPPTTNIVGSFNTTIVVPPDPGKGTKPPGNWYTKWWKKSPTTAVLTHVAVIVGTGFALKGGGGHKSVNGAGDTIE